MRLTIAFAAALPLALAALPAIARQNVQPPQPAGNAPALPNGPRAPVPTMFADPVALMIAGFDSNGDGQVSRAEFDDGLRHSFEAIDTRHAGHFGYIAFGDWAERWLGNRDALPSPFDVDRDGDNQVSVQELADRFDAYFKQYDKNGDGVITRAELLTLRPAVIAPLDIGRKGKRGKGGTAPD